jgi:hypothetical protein
MSKIIKRVPQMVLILLIAGVATHLSAANYPGETALSYAPATVSLSGDAAHDITLTAVTTSTGGSTLISGGKVQFEIATDGGVVPLPVASTYPGLVWLQLHGPGETPVVTGPNEGTVVMSFDLDALGAETGMTIGFRAHYKTGGGSDKVSEHKSGSLDIVIGDFVCTGFHLSTDRVGGPGQPQPGDSGSWTFRVRARNCTGQNLSDIKIQGGTNGWANFDSSTPSAGSVSVKSNKRNEVLTWTVSIADLTDATLDITMTGTIPHGAACSTDPDEPEPESVRNLSGTWSASNPVIGKVEAPSQASIVVVCAAE